MHVHRIGQMVTNAGSTMHCSALSDTQTLAAYLTVLAYVCRYHDVDPKNYQLIEHLVRKGEVLSSQSSVVFDNQNCKLSECACVLWLMPEARWVQGTNS